MLLDVFKIGSIPIRVTMKISPGMVVKDLAFLLSSNPFTLPALEQPGKHIPVSWLVGELADGSGWIVLMDIELETNTIRSCSNLVFEDENSAEGYLEVISAMFDRLVGATGGNITDLGTLN